MYDLQNICLSVCILTRQVCEFIREEKNKINQEAVEVKSLNNFVTYVDKPSERLLIEKLSELLPEAGFIAEENTSDKKGVIYNWVVDPLDGTTNFIHGLPCYCISIGLIRNNTLVNNLGIAGSFGIKDERIPSTSVVINNYSFNSGTNYSITYTNGITLPIISGSLSANPPGLPSDAGGVLDNTSVEL